MFCSFLTEFIKKPPLKQNLLFAICEMARQKYNQKYNNKKYVMLKTSSNFLKNIKQIERHLMTREKKSVQNKLDFGLS
jgi:hypothetical protein